MYQERALFAINAQSMWGAQYPRNCIGAGTSQGAVLPASESQALGQNSQILIL